RRADLPGGRRHVLGQRPSRRRAGLGAWSSRQQQRSVSMTHTPALALSDHARLMAGYNRWMNQKLYEQVLALPEAELILERGAFFGSIFGTLNHLCVADVIWLKRFASSALSPLAELDAWPAPTSLTMPMADNIQALWEKRQQLDDLIERWVLTL